MSFNCVCELMPDGLTFTEESGILALIAPRALRLCNGLQDTNLAFQASEMRKSLQAAQKIYAAYEVPEKINCAVYDISHGYHPEFLREMLGFFDLHLKHIGGGKPWDELPLFQMLPMEKLQVFPSGIRPSNVPSIANYLTRRNASLCHVSTIDPGKLRQIFRLNQALTLDNIDEIPVENGFSRFILTGSDGRIIPVLLRPPRKGHHFIIITAPEGKEQLQNGKMWLALAEMEDGLVIIDLWGCGENDHDFKRNHQIDMVSRSLIWLGQTLQGKWIEDYQLTECFLMKYDPNAVIAAAGVNESTIAAIAFGAMRASNTALFLENVPDSLEFESLRNHKLNMAMLIPGILKFYNIDDLLKAAGGVVRKYD